MEQASRIFHEGELIVQARAGVTAQQRKRVEAFIRPEMPVQHRVFFESLPVLFLGLLDDRGRPWATPVVGQPGFVMTPSAGRMTISNVPILGREFELSMSTGDRVGVLGLEFATRRRNRMNGIVGQVLENGFSIDVHHSFGNCPKYIQKRAFAPSETERTALRRRAVKTSDPAIQNILLKADTFLIASRSADVDSGTSAGVDVSHRGGRPGFLLHNNDGSLSFPDYKGNMFFNTFGNIEVDGRVGLFIPDFQTGDAVYVTGRAAVDWTSERTARFAGAERIVDIWPDEVWYAEDVLPLTLAEMETAPELLSTSEWTGTGRAQGVQEDLRTLRVVSRTRESDVITSFELVPADGKPLHRHTAGQFLPIQILDGEETIRRSYTISKAPDDHSYRLSIKREEDGRASTVLHDSFDVGDTLQAGRPAGAFVLDTGNLPVVMLSAGVGITPMIAMLEAQLDSIQDGEKPREVWFLHSARNGREHAFGAWLRELQRRYDWFRCVTTYTAPDDADRIGYSHELETRLNVETLRRMLPFGVYEFYLCGPASFMCGLYRDLQVLGVDAGRIHYEFFGAGSLEENSSGDLDLPEEVLLRFASSGKQVTWRPHNGTLLETAISAGCRPEFSCGGGSCGTCAVRVISGEVQYVSVPVVPIPDGQVLLCSAYPKSRQPVTLDL
ncbi:2Fe-2S iron-sulfur cluster-binding protein [Roseibium sp.]|uniref:2Fe-2S iron-sulfur cluster-binding protein n=1 Tax=Roseibium sp. TaxID=1936156 RepID=UPI003A972DA4